jgi:hypothetical protein
VMWHPVVSTIRTDVHSGHNLETADYNETSVYVYKLTRRHMAQCWTPWKRLITYILLSQQHHLHIQGASFIAFPSTAALSYTKRTSASTSRDNRHAQGKDKGNGALFTAKITTHWIQVTGPIAAFLWQ